MTWIKVAGGVLFIVYYLLCTSCGNTANDLYRQTTAVAEYGWTHADSLTYAFDVTDTSEIYTLSLLLEHTPDYPRQNLYFDISTTYPGGKRLEQVISADVYSKQGLAQGRCSDDLCSLEVVLQEKARFEEVGTYRIGLVQYTRLDTLTGVQGVGFRVREWEIK